MFLVSSDPARLRPLSISPAGLRRALTVLGLMLATSATPSYAQAPPPLGTLVNFSVVAGTTITNTGTSVLFGNIAVSPGAAVVGFPPGVVTGTIHAADAVALQAQSDLSAAYLSLLGRPTTVNLTGQNLGGLVLIPGVYNFANSAQLTGTLTLNALGNPNAVFIFNIGSTLTTASASNVVLINGAQGGNVFWRVGSSATLGTGSVFNGDILAQASITLDTGASITCGAAFARSGAVTLDTNTISLCALLVGPGVVPLPGGGVVVLGPTGVPLLAFLLPTGSDNSQRAAATAIDNFVANGGTLPLAFLNLYNLSGADLAAAFSQLQGEAGTGIAPAGTQAMNSFLSLMTNPFNFSRGQPIVQQEPRPGIYKAPVKAKVGAAAPAGEVSGRWNIWGAAYGSSNSTGGDRFAGSHDRTTRTFGYAAGLDYRVTPYTTVGFALGGGRTNFSIDGGFGSGYSDMFQAALYASTQFGAAYLSAAVAYGWHNVSTSRYVTIAGTDNLTADFVAHSLGARLEGGYRFVVPDPFDSWTVGVTPYAAVQWQTFRTPSYSEVAASGSSMFALNYEARATNTLRTELGVWLDKTYSLGRNTGLVTFARAAWAHDTYSDPSVVASFQALPGSSFTEFGAAPVRDSLLLTAGAELSNRYGWAVMAKLDGEVANGSHTYTGTARLRYAW